MLSTITWPDIIALLQAVFTFLTAGIAFVTIGMNRNMKAVDVSLGCQTRHAELLERLYRLPYNNPEEGGGHPGIDTHALIPETELFALFNIYWHLVHDEYQYWRDRYITNEMFFRWVDGVFDEFKADYAYFLPRGAQPRARGSLPHIVGEVARPLVPQSQLRPVCDRGRAPGRRRGAGAGRGRADALQVRASTAASRKSAIRS